ncbi:hypothetical protein CHARACLAT_001578 [Characodon lateralis]|uniref:Secreted protein n=1 Tax=Characodon lateralis TaxID=208331 RepID=A0ABU7F0S6_9TELE|nr:hypothetical protein [Characodon lateralis]
MSLFFLRLITAFALTLEWRFFPAAADILPPPPCIPPSLPREQTGMVSSRRVHHCHLGGEGSRSAGAKRGWKRKASSTACHCSAAAAAALEPHQGDRFLLCKTSTSTPRRHLQFRR